MAQLRLLHSAPLSLSARPSLPPPTRPLLPALLPNRNPSPTLSFSLSSGGGGASGGATRDGGGGGDDENGASGPLAPLLIGWRSRVAADPEFPFKVLMEEVVGVGSCVLGDMASRPNFGLDELDLVFSTVVVGCIVNFVLMYLLAPTAASSQVAAASAALPWIFSGCPKSHMFEPGGFGVVHRLGTCVYKGAVFSAVGFAAGLVGTGLSNGVIGARKRMDPRFQAQNEPPPPLLNAATWAVQMGISSNLRYQTLNAVEFFIARGLPPPLFKASVVALRCFNNVVGGMTFVALARITGSQSKGGCTRTRDVALEDGSGSGSECA